jgi:hypothetical protein
MVKAFSCVFYNCKWRYDGVKKETEEMVSCDWKVSPGDGEYSTFVTNGASKKIIQWQRLLLTVASISERRTCDICQSEIKRTSKVVAPECCQKDIHEYCLRDWQAQDDFHKGYCFCGSATNNGLTRAA